MLLFVLMLQTVTTPPQIVSNVGLSAPASTGPLRLMPDCRAERSCAGGGDPDRLVTDPVRLVDPKAEALKGTWANCGVTGMAMCPMRPRKMFSTTLGE